MLALLSSSAWIFVVVQPVTMAKRMRKVYAPLFLQNHNTVLKFYPLPDSFHTFWLIPVYTPEKSFLNLAASPLKPEISS